MSILPVYTALILAICFALTARAQRLDAIQSHEARAVFGLLAAFVIWTGAVVYLGLNGTHVSLMQSVPLLWQAFVPIGIWMTAFVVSRRLRNAVLAIGEATPAHWLVLIQALRIGAIGGIVKGLQGDILSTYVFWIGIPDFLFGISALGLAWLMRRGTIDPGILVAWNVLGIALIVIPTFVPMAYWMNEPGFDFIFAFPMILAPSIVVSLMISLNVLHTWVARRQALRA